MMWLELLVIARGHVEILIIWFIEDPYLISSLNLIQIVKSRPQAKNKLQFS